MRQELDEWLEELACRAGLDGLPRVARPAALVAAAALLGTAVWWWGFAPASDDATASAPATGSATIAATASDSAASVATASSAMPAPAALTSVTVHVVGAVRRPGVYVLVAGARAADAIAAAGGLAPKADQAGVNLARQVIDGEQIVVPVKGRPPVSGAGGGGGAGGAPGAGASPGVGGKVDLNTATAEQLDALPGVGPATAQKIIADRTENGPFRTPEDLMRVSGIGPKRFDSLKDLVSTR